MTVTCQFAVAVWSVVLLFLASFDLLCFLNQLALCAPYSVLFHPDTFSLLSVIIFLVSAMHLGTKRRQSQIKMMR